MGHLSHAFQDYYAHADPSDERWLCGNNRTGDWHITNAPGADMKPASWGGNLNRGEQRIAKYTWGGTIEPGMIERLTALTGSVNSREFTAGEFRTFVGQWWGSCQCYAKVSISW